jgi:hypothetical protein
VTDPEAVREAQALPTGDVDYVLAGIEALLSGKVTEQGSIEVLRSVFHGLLNRDDVELAALETLAQQLAQAGLEAPARD